MSKKSMCLAGLAALAVDLAAAAHGSPAFAQVAPAQPGATTPTAAAKPDDLATADNPLEPPPASVEAPAPKPAPPPEPPSKTAAWVTGAVAIVATGVGVGFALRTRSLKSDFDDKPTHDTADAGKAAGLIADLLFGVAITCGLTSAVLFLSNDAPKPAKVAAPGAPRQVGAAEASKKITVTAAPYVTFTGGGAGALVRF